jgi:branched-chain amino acid transport system substrate-binding protein
MNFRKIVKGSLAAGMALTLAACESTTASGASTAAAAASAAGTAAAAASSGNAGAGTVTAYTLGFIGPLEGSTAVYGNAVANGAQMAIEDYNKANGTDIKLEKFDSKGDATQAVNGYNKLVTETKVAAIVGPTLSGESTAVGTASQATGVPILTPSGTAKDVTLTGPNVFRGCYTDPFQAKAAADFAYDTLGAKTAAIIYNTADDYSTGLTENFTTEFESKGGKVVASEGFGADDVDFNTQLTTIQAENVDVLYVPNYYEKDALIAKQAKSLGITSTLLGGDGWDGVLSQVQAGTDDEKALEGAVFINHYSPDQEAVQDVLTRYKAEFNSDANAFSVLAYDSATLMMQCVATAGTLNYADIVKALQNVEFKGVLGNLKFDENGDPIKDVAYVTIKDGQYVTYGK